MHTRIYIYRERERERDFPVNECEKMIDFLIKRWICIYEQSIYIDTYTLSSTDRRSIMTHVGRL